MKKIRNCIVCAALLAMVLSLAACGGKKNDKEEIEKTEAASKQEISSEDGGEEADGETEENDVEEINNPSEETGMPSEEGDILYVYSWNDQFEDKLQYFREKYPQYADRIEYVNLDEDSGAYNIDLETLLQGKYEETEKYPSIIALDNSSVLDYVQSDYTLPMSELGISEEDTKNMYPYTLDYVTYEDEVKALTWQATPGVVCYRTDIAELVFGSGKPEVVQEAIADWDSFLATAERMKEFGYKMVSGPDDIKYAFYDAKEEPWVTDEHLNIDESVYRYLTVAKRLKDEEYTGETTIESEEWFANVDKDVFCYFGNPQFFYWTLNPEAHAGDYNICEGPAPYHWGGTYLTVGRECPDKSLAALFLKTICCDTEVMEKIEEDTFDFVNNKEAVAHLIAADIGISEICGDFNPLPTFDAVAGKVDVSKSTIYDAKFNGYVDNVLPQFLEGDAEDKREAVERVKDQVSDAYNYIKID